MVQHIILSITATGGKNILLGYPPHLAVKPTGTAGRFKPQMNFTLQRLWHGLFR